MRTLNIIVLALIGFALSCYVIYLGQKTTPVIPSKQTYPSSPYESFIAGQGIIESEFKNIPIGSSYSDVVTKVYVQVGDVVERGAKLFETDTSRFQAQYNQALKEQAVAQQQYINQDIQFSYYKNLSDVNAVSKVAYTTAEYNKKIAAENLEKAKATVAIYKADIERSIVRAPIDGEVLEVNIRPGQFTGQSFMTDQPFILFGNTQDLHLRIDIDEEDSWRYEKGSSATAYVRGNYSISIPLEFVYLEPYIIPKKSLTGSDIERVDTRVLQVVYRFKKNKFPVYLGQLLDVYIQAKPHESRSW